ncbi:MAG: phosphoribosyl-AMP cyclohydrolase [Bacteroidota bacterium]
MNIKVNAPKQLTFMLLAALFLVASPAYSQATVTVSTTASVQSPITMQEVEAAQQAWGEGIVAIGKTYTENGDFRAAASDHVREFYAYGTSLILFKPTLAAEDQFRGDFGEALSYFVGTEGTEDGGFAIAPYTNVRWENEGTIIDNDGDMAMAMGNYFFTGTDGNVTKVEYTFGYMKDESGDLKIVLHHSSLPFSAN